MVSALILRFSGFPALAQGHRNSPSLKRAKNVLQPIEFVELNITRPHIFIHFDNSKVSK